MTVDRYFLAGWRDVRRVGIRTPDELRKVIRDIDPLDEKTPEEQGADIRLLIDLCDQGVIAWDAASTSFVFTPAYSPLSV